MIGFNIGIITSNSLRRLLRLHLLLVNSTWHFIERNVFVKGCLLLDWTYYPWVGGLNARIAGNGGLSLNRVFVPGNLEIY